MNITESYVSFEVAKLLKEKGFDEPTRWLYVNSTLKEGARIDNWNSITSFDYVSAPTLQMAQKWLREKLQIHANAIQQGNYNDFSKYYSWIVSSNQTIYRNQSVSEKLSYEEAVEAAIKYTLENLI